MRTRYTSIFTLLPIFGASCVGPGAELGPADRDDPLLGRSTADATCNDAQRALATQALRYGRAASSTVLFEQCVTRAVTGPGAVNIGGMAIGPYVRCTGDQNYDEPRAVQASRALGAARSINHVEYGCNGTLGVGSTGDFFAWDHTRPERFVFNGSLLNAVIATLSNPVCRRDGAGNVISDGTCRWEASPWPYTAYANTFWHEAMHTHGYGHGINFPEDDRAGGGRAACGVAAGTPFHFQQNTLPYIVGHCVDAVIRASHAACGEAHNSSMCRFDQLRMLTSGVGEAPTCGCVDDPRLARIAPVTSQVYAGGAGVYATVPPTGAIQRYEAATRSWTTVGGAGRMFAVNDRALYGLSVDGAHVLQHVGGGSWVTIGYAASRILAGGDNLYAIHPTSGEIWRYEGRPFQWTRVGGPGAHFVANRAGLFALSVDRRQVLRFDGSSWTVIGGAAGWLYAGPTTLYASGPDGSYITRFDGSRWTRIAYDPYGVLSGGGEVVDTGEAVYLRRGREARRHAPVAGALERWEVFDSNTQAIYAGVGQLLLQRPDGSLYRAIAP